MIHLNNSNYLFFIPIVLAPVIIYFFIKPRISRLMISYLYFIVDSYKKVQQLKNLKNLMLQVIRILLMLCIIFLFAEPFYSSIKNKNMNTYSLILIDNSLSMSANIGDETLLNRAKDIARNIVQLRLENEKIATANFNIDVNSDFIFDDDNARILQNINSIDESLRNTFITKSLVNAFDNLKSLKNVKKRIILISDFVSDAELDWLKNVDDKIDLLCIRLDTAYIKNLSIKDAQFQDKVVYKNTLTKINLSIANNVNKNYENKFVEIFNDNQFSNNILFSIKARENLDIVLAQQFDKIGEHVLEFRLDNDDLNLDNSYFMPVRVSRKTSILLVDGDLSNTPVNAETYYISKAISSNIKDYTCEIMTSSEFLGLTDFSGYEIIFLTNVSELNITTINKLRAFLRRGKTVFISLGDNIDPVNYNLNMQDVLAAHIKNIVDDEGFEIHANDIIDDKYLSSSTCDKFYSLDINSYNHVILDCVNKKIHFPFLIKHRYLDNQNFGNVYLLTSSIDVAWNNMAYKPAYVVLWQSLIGAVLEEKNESLNNIFIGDTYVYNFRYDEGFPSNVIVEYPDHRQKFLTVKRGNAEYITEFSDADMPGIYSLKWDSQRGNNIKTFAVNVNPVETNYSNFIYEQFSENCSRCFNVKKIVVSDFFSLEKKLKKFLYGNALFNYIFVVIIILLCLEIIIYLGFLDGFFKYFLHK